MERGGEECSILASSASELCGFVLVWCALVYFRSRDTWVGGFLVRRGGGRASGGGEWGMEGRGGFGVMRFCLVMD